MVNAVAEGAEFVTLRPSARRAVRSFRHPFRTSAGEGDRLPAADGIRDRVLSSSALGFYTASEILITAVLATTGVILFGGSAPPTICSFRLRVRRNYSERRRHRVGSGLIASHRRDNLIRSPK